LPRTTLNLIFLKVYQFVTKGCQLFSEILSYDLQVLFLKILNLKLKNIRVQFHNVFKIQIPNGIL